MFSVSYERQKGEYVRAIIPCSFDQYASQIRTPSASFQDLFHGYDAQDVPVLVPLIIMSFFFEHLFLFEIVLMSAHPKSWIQIDLIRLFILRLVL